MKKSSKAALAAFAARFPDVETGVACKGTAIESTTYKTRGKAFLFLREKDARLKLGPSVASAAAFAKKDPARCEVGKFGWILMRLGADDPIDLYKTWIAESRDLMSGASASKAPKKKVAPKKKPAAKRGSR